MLGIKISNFHCVPRDAFSQLERFFYTNTTPTDTEIFYYMNVEQSFVQYSNVFVNLRIKDQTAPATV
jgi:hypothetical protein